MSKELEPVLAVSDVVRGAEEEEVVGEEDSLDPSIARKLWLSPRGNLKLLSPVVRADPISF